MPARNAISWQAGLTTPRGGQGLAEKASDLLADVAKKAGGCSAGLISEKVDKRLLTLLESFVGVVWVMISS